MPQPEPSGEAVSGHLTPLIFVLGMHRSGTSMLTRVLNLIGIETSCNLMLPGPDNQTGYWESKAVVALNERILKSAGSAWYDPRPFSSERLSKEQQNTFVLEARDLLLKELSGTGPSVLKDPRLCRTAQFWIEAARLAGYKPKAICIIRTQSEVVASLVRRNGISDTHAALLSQSYCIELEVNSRSIPRYCVRDERIIADWKEELRPALTALGLERFLPDHAVNNGIDAFIDPSERHHSAPAEPSSLPSNKPPGRDIYDCLRADREMTEQLTYDQMVTDWKTYWEIAEQQEDAIDYSETMPQGFIEKSELCLENDQPKEALRWLAKGISAFPDEPKLYVRTGNLLLHLDRADEALLFLEHVTEIDPRAPGNFGALTRAYLRLSRLDDAKRAILAGLTLSPERSGFLNLAGRIHLQLNDPEAARSFFETLTNVDKEKAVGWAGLAEALLILNEPERALVCCMEALSLAPDAKPYKKLRRRISEALKNET